MLVCTAVRKLGANEKRNFVFTEMQLKCNSQKISHFNKGKLYNRISNQHLGIVVSFGWSQKLYSCPAPTCMLILRPLRLLLCALLAEGLFLWQEVVIGGLRSRQRPLLQGGLGISDP
jgi:hypothetical protein